MGIFGGLIAKSSPPLEIDLADRIIFLQPIMKLQDGKITRNAHILMCMYRSSIYTYIYIFKYTYSYITYTAYICTVYKNI